MTCINKYSYLIVFSVALVLRLIPEILAYPYPIGYDVINYYLPILKNFDDYSATISNQFPLYISLLHTISSTMNVDPRIVITSAVVLLYGLFSLVILSIANKLLHLDNLQSVFLSIFVIFQFSVLRTSWDLHKDLFAITLAFLCLYYIEKSQNYRKMLAVIIPLGILIVLADRMIGFLFSISLIISSIIRRDRILGSIAIFIIIVFGFFLITNFDPISTNLQLAGNKYKINEIYNPVNLIVLFLVMNAILLPAGVVGVLKSKSTMNIFKIPFFISLVASFSWVVFPNTSAFLPDRWITIFSIFLSLFSGYGFVLLIEKGYFAISNKKLNNYLVILIPFIFLGSAFAMSPNNSYLNIYGIFHPYISQYGPLTMQSNSISLPESTSLLSAIEWINNHTQEGSVIMGSKHLRGWMEIELKGRTFLFADNNTRLLESNKYSELYLLEINSRKETKMTENYLQTLSYNNTDFSLYHLKRID
ncbi:MAG: hypothetical protein QOB17_04930 [Nitrososphaeraceae archaeon]|nr:hypothetical protein [Nitrososphaeraceae archaeon]